MGEDAFVCPEHVDDRYLASLLDDWLSEATAGETGVCSFCEEEPRAGAPIDVLVEAVEEAFNRYFTPANDAGVPREEGEWQWPTLDTSEALEELGGLDWPVLEAVAPRLEQDDWVGYDEPQRSISERMRHGWRDFSATLRHTSRFLLVPTPPSSEYDPDPDLSPLALLEAIGAAIRKSPGMVCQITSTTPLYRARTFDEAPFTKSHEVSAPPPRLAAQGRMNAAGVSVFYGALDPETAAAEVYDGKQQVAIADFVATRHLTVVDLTQIPEVSPFDPLVSRRDVETAVFLRGFVDEIAMPIVRDSRIHYEYTPTQYFTEFLRWRLLPDEVGVDGIIYPSARTQGKNIVVFAGPAGCLTDRELPTGVKRRVGEEQVLRLASVNVHVFTYGAPTIKLAGRRTLHVPDP